MRYMSTAEVRCPNCGGVSSRASRADEYICDYCGARFHFVRPDVRKYEIDRQDLTTLLGLAIWCGVVDRKLALYYFGDGDA